MHHGSPLHGMKMGWGPRARGRCSGCFCTLLNLLLLETHFPRKSNLSLELPEDPEGEGRGGRGRTELWNVIFNRLCTWGQEGAPRSMSSLLKKDSSGRSKA